MCIRDSLYEGGEEVVTYSIPLVDQRGRAVGVFGVEISLNSLYKYLPPSDLLAVDSYGYVTVSYTHLDVYKRQT